MRAFARMLDVPAPVVSEVLRGKRKLLPKYAERICKQLLFSDEKTTLFINSTLQHREGLSSTALTKNKSDQKLVSTILMEDLYSKAIEEWEYFAILSLFKTNNFKENSVWIGSRLGISKERARHVVLDLKQLGLLERGQTGHLERVHSRLSSTIDVPSISVRKSHHDTLRIAQEKLDSTPIEKRFYTSETMAIDVENIDDAKQLIRDFKSSLAKLIEKGNKTQVYRLAVQLFPLSKTD